MDHLIVYIHVLCLSPFPVSGVCPAFCKLHKAKPQGDYKWDLQTNRQWPPLTNKKFCMFCEFPGASGAVMLCNYLGVGGCYVNQYLCIGIPT
jgi:hypothetical protein